MEVYVIRHTQVATGNEICYGQSEVPLASTFEQEAAFYKNNLPSDFEVVFCSPLNRCKDLSGFLNYKNVIFENALMEMNFGDWENKKWNDIDQEDLNFWMNDFVNVNTPNGENLLDLYTRLKSFLDHLRLSPYKKVLLVTHAGIIRCIWAYLLDIPLQNIFRIPVAYSEQFIFKLANLASFDTIVQKK